MRRILFFFAVTASLALPAQAFRLYLIGNSVTDGINYSAFETLCGQGGQTLDYGRHMIPGAPLEWTWNHSSDGFCEPSCYPDALANLQWDGLSLQPFDRDENSDFDYASRFINLARGRSANLKTFIFGRWPRLASWQSEPHITDCASWDRQWLGQSGKEGSETRAYFEGLVTRLRGQFGNTAIYLAPVGEAFYQFNQMIKNGQVSGITNITQIYQDGIHLTNVGSYIVGCTYYAVVFRDDPVGLPASAYSVSADQAAKIQQAVWRAVAQHPLAGVNGQVGVRDHSAPVFTKATSLTAAGL